MNAIRKKLSEKFLDSAFAQQQSGQWETLIVRLLQRLELPPETRKVAEQMYADLARQIADNLGARYEDVRIYPQGSMRTQTTIPQRHPKDFDLDIIVELGYNALNYSDAEDMFQKFGDALKGNEVVTGSPKPKPRCWRLEYPNKPFYFDVTPAVPDVLGITGAGLKVRDPITTWSPTNPEDFALWFCERADLRFPFAQRYFSQDSVLLEKAEVKPLPNDPVALDDVLRRTIQLIKLHRDSSYWYAPPERKAVQPISVILVTLATLAYEKLYRHHRQDFKSPIQLVLAIIDEMPNYIEYANGQYRIENPRLSTENFADKWNFDKGRRSAEFDQWHQALQSDLEALMFQSEKDATQEQIRKVFGDAGVEAWKASRPSEGLKSGLLAGLLLGSNPVPKEPTKIGSSDTVG